MNLGEKIQSLRKSRGLSQEQLSEQLAVSRQAVSKWELNESSPDVEKIVQMSEFFGVTTDYLLKESTKPIKAAKEHDTTGRILIIAGVAFLAMGLLIAIGGWYDVQNGASIAGGMMVQVVGLVGYFIGRTLSQIKPSFGVNYLAGAILAFMPASILVCAILRTPVSPYPTDIRMAVFFAVPYGIALLVMYKKMRK